ncbi:MAG: MBOAT family protein [Ruminococcaceae bacterium]|nr:MBOAT family protein [Oscillospiraceae bacterium]
MQFASLSFILFAAITVLLYYTVPKKRQWWILLAASYLFYFAAGASYLLFILYTTLVTYLTARVLQKHADREDAYVRENRETLSQDARKAYRAMGKKRRFRILICGLILGFGLLAVIKYTAFALSGVNGILRLFTTAELSIPNLLLPLGISFYTFQSMGYLIDVCRKKCRAEQNIAKLALFVSYFPQLIQGPISRFSSLGEQLFVEHCFNGEEFRAGMLRVAWGFFKKLVVADTVAQGVKVLIAESGDFQGIYVFLLILLYSIQIYGDFTGGIDITIGLSRMLGIKLAENFDRPFSSTSTKEYWRRWHITMGSWFTDYVFYPLSVCKPMQKLSKSSRARLGEKLGKRIPVYLATIVTWFLTGLWHGAGWNFIVWGLLNCLVILVSQELTPLYHRFHARFPRLVVSAPWIHWQMIRTFLLMGLIRSLDCYRDVPKTFRLWGSMFTVFNAGELFHGGLTAFGLTVADWAVVLVGVLVIWQVSRIGKDKPFCDRIAKKPILCTALLCMTVFVVLVFGAYGIGYDASQFIYNQF